MIKNLLVIGAIGGAAFVIYLVYVNDMSFGLAMEQLGLKINVLWHWATEMMRGFTEIISPSEPAPTDVAPDTLPEDSRA